MRKNGKRHALMQGSLNRHLTHINCFLEINQHTNQMLEMKYRDLDKKVNTLNLCFLKNPSLVVYVLWIK